MVSSEQTVYDYNPSCICTKSEIFFEINLNCTGFDGSVLVDRQEHDNKMAVIRISKKKCDDNSQ